MLLAAVSSVATDANGDFKDLHGVVGGSDLSMFRKVGPGECFAAASRPVRGRARMEMEHLGCRQNCVDPCIGYTYAPCERICTLHGNPPSLKNTSEEDGWTTVNGGGAIVGVSKRCGSSCYERLAQCAPSKVVSNQAQINTGDMAYGSTYTPDCPAPFTGMLKVRCGLYGPFVEAGRCRAPCPASKVVNGNFDVPYAQFEHGTLQDAICPQGASGIIKLQCNDGKAQILGGACGYDCVLGSMVVGDAVLSYPDLGHRSEFNVTCPTDCTGNVTMLCDDSSVGVVRGTCNYNCDPGEMVLKVGDTLGMIVFGALNHSETNETDCEPDTNFTGKITLGCDRGKVSIVDGHCKRHCLPAVIGQGVKAVTVPRFDHETGLTIPCSAADRETPFGWRRFMGELEVECVDGNATIMKGECTMNCLWGAVTSNNVRIPHPAFNHSEWLNLTCEGLTPFPGHMGHVIADCDDGAVTFTGGCGENCGPGEWFSHGAVVPWDFIGHKMTSNLTCPGPWQGSVLIECYDGSFRYKGQGLKANGGWCGNQCKAGNINENGAVVYYPIMNHTSFSNYGCDVIFDTGLSFSGGVKVWCDDGYIFSDGYCEADCPDGKMWANGAQVYFPSMMHLQKEKAVCAPGTWAQPLFGQVDVQCKAGYAKVFDGTCGAPCLAGAFKSKETRDDPVEHPTIGHMFSKWAICPAHLSGYVHLFCKDGMVQVIGDGTCGDRCPPKTYLTGYGVNMDTPVMEHLAQLEYTCNEPGFKGTATVECMFGNVLVNSTCQNQCQAGNVTLTISGAVIDFPKMQSDEMFYTSCPPGRFLDMPVVIQCKDGKGVVYSGGCFKNCEAGWFYDPAHPWGKPGAGESWTLQHYLILHDTVSVEPCPQYYDGYVTLYCNGGEIAVKEGFCSINCRPARKQIRPGVVIRNAEMVTGELAAQIPCPPMFDGSMRLLCTSGIISLGEGGCNATCPPGVMDTAMYGELSDSRSSEIACPDVGTIYITCNDGTVTRTGGPGCAIGCPAGTQIDANGTKIEYPYIRHGESVSGVCSGLAKGVVTIRCNNSVAIQEPRPGEMCLRHCEPATVITPLGTTIFAPNTAHGNQATVRCPNGLAGLVTVSCYDTVYRVIDGDCGDMNCGAGELLDNGALLSHFTINNGWRAGPSKCQEPWEGIATFRCDNGTVRVEEVTVLLPVSPDDHAAVAVGNESSSDSRFIMCGCCNVMAAPPPAEAIKGLDTGIYMWLAASAGGLALLLAAFAGWYSLPRKKRARVWPEKVKPADPRPMEEESLNAVLDEFHMKLQVNPKLAQRALENNLHLKALAPKEQSLAIENMKQNPQEAMKFLTRRSVQYLLAVEGGAARGPPSPSQQSRAPRDGSSTLPTLEPLALPASPPVSPAPKLTLEDVNTRSVGQRMYIEDMQTQHNLNTPSADLR